MPGIQLFGDKKALRGASLPFPTYGGGGGAFGISGGSMWQAIYGGLPGDGTNWVREAGQPHLNSIVGAAVNWLGRVGPESPPCVITVDADGSDELDHAHPLLDLLHNPNDDYSGAALEAALWLSFVTFGNAYVLKRPRNDGSVSLWYEPHWNVRAVWPKDGSEWISGYAIQRDGKWYEVPKDAVIHLRNGLDPMSPRYGRNPITAALRQICAANEADVYTWAILKNMGILGLIVMPESPDVAVDEADAITLRDKIVRWFTGANRGNAYVSTIAMKIAEMGKTPNDMALKDILPQLEASVLSSIGLSPMVVGAKVGLDHSTYSNYEEAIAAAYRGCIMPTKAMWAREWTMQLLRPMYRTPDNVHIGYDYSKVRELQDDEDAKVKRLVEAAGGAVMTVDEARGELGLAPMGGDAATIRKPVAPPADNAPGDPASSSKNAAPLLHSFLKGWMPDGRTEQA